MQRDPPPGASDDLGDPGAHLPGADDKDVLEAHTDLSLLRMKRVLTALLLAAVLAGVAGAAPARPDLVLGVEWRAGGGQLAWRSATTLRPAGPAINVGGASIELMAVSPDAKLAALARSDGQLRIVELRPLRSIWKLALGSPVAAAAWADRDRLVAVTGGEVPAIVVVDMLARRVTSRRELDGDIWSAVAGGRRVVALLAPARAIGPARLAVVDGDGSLRAVRLVGVSAGFTPAPDDEGTGRQASPGLALDPTGSQAVVVGLDTVLSVDLETLRQARKPIRRPARAAKRIEGWSRHAVWLGGGRIAVVGRTFSFDGDRQGSATIGLQVQRLGSTEVRVLDETAWGVIRSGETLLGVGGTGLRGYRLDGSLRFELLRGADTGYVQVAGRFAYVGSGNSTRFTIVDVRLGRIVGTARTAKPTVVLR